MRNSSNTHSAALLAVTSFLALFAAASAPAAAAVDEMITVAAGQRVVAPLPGGPASPPSAVDPQVDAIFALPSGQILAAATLPIPGGGTGPNPFYTSLNELLPDGSLREIAPIDGIGGAPLAVADMDLDHRGRFYLLLRLGIPSSSAIQTQLREIDPATGGVLGSRIVDDQINSIATAPDGLWANVNHQLRKLDPATLQLGPIVATLGTAGNLEADSRGRLYFNRVCSPACSRLATLDPEVGVVEEAPAALYAGITAVSRFTIHRRCYSSATAICLQDGRFRAAVEYATPAGESGPAQVAPARSRDTGIFFFFAPDNWELMVKVLDGCAINSRFWVYSSASTDVGYTMTVTDSATGAEQVYRNPVGQVALTVADGNAFACP